MTLTRGHAYEQAKTRIEYDPNRTVGKMFRTVATLAEDAGGEVLRGDPGARVGQISTDTRKIAPGDFFVALQERTTTAMPLPPRLQGRARAR